MTNTTTSNTFNRLRSLWACARSLTDEQAGAVADLLVLLADAEDEAADIPPDELCRLLGELAAAGDADGLFLALHLSPHDGLAYVDRLRELVATADPAQLADATAARAELARILMDCPKPGRVIGPVTAEAILDGIEAWRRLTTETPEQRVIREAFAEARRLIDLHGEEDHRAFHAIVKAVELQDPGCCTRMLAEGGIVMPAPTHCAEDGTRLYSLDSIADALGADVGDLQAVAEDMEAVGLDMRRTVAGRLH
ncbi:MAG: hypothetical protein RL456_1234 [Pseudomonadota bacterium]|jgi:hypothetical protein